VDTKKLVLLVLVVIAILCAMALGAGVYQGRRQGSGSDSLKGSLSAFFRGLMPDHTTLAPGRLHVVSGCTVSGSGPGGVIAMGSAPCNIVIREGRKREPEMLWLDPAGSTATPYACFQISAEKFADCPSGPEDKRKFDRKSSFTVGRDSAFLRLYCSGGLNPICRFTIR